MEQKIDQKNESSTENIIGKQSKRDIGIIVQIVIIAILGIVVAYYFGKGGFGGSNAVTGNVISNTLPSVSAAEIMPSGVPKIYGKELGVNYDDVSATNLQKAESTIKVLGNLDTSIKLTGSDLQCYIGIASQISCEYCCGADSIIFENGDAACGCAHSYAMRGLAKYLIKNHGSEFSDDEILEEMGKWKVLFFPAQHQAKASALKDKGIELNYINLASNKYRGIEQGQTGGMVGGC